MEVKRNVILDLLPLYIADEASAETRALVEEYLKGDPELAEIARRSREMNLTNHIPAPASREKELESYLEAKRQLFRQAVTWAAIIFAVSAFIVVAVIFIAMFVRSV